MSVSEALALVERTGRLEGPVTVDGDLDLLRLRAPKTLGSRPIVFHAVTFKGTVHGVAQHAVKFKDGDICVLDASERESARALEFDGTRFARMQFGGARLAADFTCLECKVCRADFSHARFGGELTLTRSKFGEPVLPDFCKEGAPLRCPGTSFFEAVFAGTARFDRVDFRSGASFHGAEFRASARFPRARAAGELAFVGTRFRGGADFRDCTLAAAWFGAKAGAAARSYESAEFAAQADFRGCTFTGPVRFDEVMFLGEALFSRATFGDNLVSFRGASASRAIDLRAATAERLTLDATAADAVRLDWDDLGAAVLRGAVELEPPKQRVVMLEALSRRLETQGAGRAAREVAFEAEREERAHRDARCTKSRGECLAGELEWWLWKRPTRNGGDPTVVLVALAALWLLVVVAGSMRGRLVVPPRRREARPVYNLVPQKEISEAAYYPAGAARLREAAKLATKLILKLGSPRARFAEQKVHRATGAALWTAWLLAWGLLAALAAVVATSFPGLNFLKAAL